MLILVGVTINYSLNGGVITKAKEASSQMQIEADKETLMMAALGSIDTNGNIDLSTMETPEGFTKAGTGKYTKGEYTYTVNGQTGAVTAKKSSGDDQEETTEKTIVGQYRSLNFVLDEMDMDVYLDFKEDGSIIAMMEDENNPGSYIHYDGLDGVYTFNAETNTGTATFNFSSGEEENTLPFNVVFTENNVIIPDFGLSGFNLATQNGSADIEGPNSEYIGTYSDGNTQYVISSATVNGINVGKITSPSDSNYKEMFICLNNKEYEVNGDYSISLTNNGTDTILIFDGNEYVKQ